jgi:DNA invertase Pin-like site-specific DNA recombinase
MEGRKPNMKIAYVRVSTAEQNDERQTEALKKYDIEKWFTEKISAKDTNRPELQTMLDYAREGDTIYIKDFSRLARSTKDLLEMVEYLNKKKVHLVSLKENIDSSTPTGKLMLTMIGAIYEFERNNLLERQKEGIILAKQKGIYKGRKKIKYPDGWKETYDKWKSRGITGTEAMKLLKLKRNTFYKLIKEFEAE